jgi:hypothetical protein
MFEPSLAAGPSGLADPPRPFVLRAAHLDGRLIEPGKTFSIDVHIFDLRQPALPSFTRAFAELANDGLGARRAKVEFESAEPLDGTGAASASTSEPLSISLEAPPESISTILVRFVTPTELKSDGTIAQPDFGVLFARVRDRVSTLRSLYGDGPLDLDFRGMAERARSVRLVRADLRHADVLRRSSRTGAVHPIGGFIGDAEYEGELREFVPFLLAGYWTGVGRHTVWGNGVILTDVTDAQSNIQGCRRHSLR